MSLLARFVAAKGRINEQIVSCVYKFFSAQSYQEYREMIEKGDRTLFEFQITQLKSEIKRMNSIPEKNAYALDALTLWNNSSLERISNIHDDNQYAALYRAMDSQLGIHEHILRYLPHYRRTVPSLVRRYFILWKEFEQLFARADPDWKLFSSIPDDI